MADADDDASVVLDIAKLRIEAHSGAQWHEILRSVDLKVRKGEVLGLVGESGAGKSTLGLAAMGYIRSGCRIAGGHVRYRGTDLFKLSAEKRRQLRGSQIAYVAQSAAAAFNPAYRIMSQCIETPVAHGVMSRQQARRDMEVLYECLQLPDPEQFGKKFPHQASGGQLQRAMTAMAMCCCPGLIVFDEPTTALDVTTQIEVLLAIKQVVQGADCAALYITHDLAVLAQMADRIMVLRDGVSVEEAPTQQILSAPSHPYTRSLWSVRKFRKSGDSTVAQEKQTLLSARNVCVNFGRFNAVRDVSFDMCCGHTVALVGESGSGKTTMARTIAGLVRPRSGSIALNGQVLPASYAQRSRSLLRSMQLIYQSSDTALNPRHSVSSILGRPLRFYLKMGGAAKKARINALLEMVELDPAQFAGRRPSELSGGQKQRISIARALAAEPKVLICDEITSSLDQLVAEGILRLLTRIQEEFQLGILFITHDLSTVQAIADDVVVMHQGKVVEQGSKKEVFSPPYAEYTALLMSSVPEMRVGWLDELAVGRKACSVKQFG